MATKPKTKQQLLQEQAASSDDSVVARISVIVDEAERMRNAYFFTPPKRASSRPSYERNHSHDEVAWSNGGHNYIASYNVSCSCHHVYAWGDYTRDGKRTNLTAIRNSLKRIKDAKEKVGTTK